MSPERSVVFSRGRQDVMHYTEVGFSSQEAGELRKEGSPVPPRGGRGIWSEQR